MKKTNGSLPQGFVSKPDGIKMLRKPDSNMTKAEVKATVDLMNFLLNEAEH